MKQRILDEWDNKMIQLFKSNRVDSLEEIKQIWADRCALDIEYVQVRDIFEHLMTLAIDMNLITPDNMLRLIEDARPENQWKFGIIPHAGKNDYYINWLRVISSFLRHTEVKYLSGYESINHGNFITS
jgi:hypothetical protein